MTSPLRLSRRSVLLAGGLGVSLLAAGVVAQWRPWEDADGLPGAPEPTDDPVEVVYCAGWERSGPVSPISEEVARAQDAAGGQYAVGLLVGGTARAVVEVCWQAHHAEVWFLDDSGRRYRGVAYRRWPDERLRLFEVRGWSSGSLPAEPAVRARVRRDASGSIENVSLDEELRGGGKLHTSPGWERWPGSKVLEEEVALPPWNGWTALAGLTGPVTVRAGSGEVPAAFPWQPPFPLRPRHVTELTTEGTRFRLDSGAVETVRRTPAGSIRLPSGTLLVGEPSWFDASSPPLAATVPPGEYAVDVFGLSGDFPETTACRVTVSDAPVTSWELGLREGDRELELGAGEFFGNPVDAATLALVDRTGATAFSEEDVEKAMSTEDTHVTVRGEKTDLVVVPGWSDGAFPVWLGRAADGSLCQYVLDFQVPGLSPA
ncbi:DUF4241 domain-containing protein [Lentzea sp. NPDC003310]|uniref:DUF4241 domain-containing protein n=1 Tax=Lentzea sp. NPDC003310 TaxID=3154447 RepID=UPI0033BBF8F7